MGRRKPGTTSASNCHTSDGLCATAQARENRCERRNVELRVLGPLELVQDDGSAVSLAVKQKRLLAALAAQPGKVRTVDSLVEALWPDRLPRDPAKVLQLYVSRLRAALAAGISIRTEDSGYVLELAEDTLDSLAFERLLVEARAASGEGNAAVALSLLERSLSLWRGPAFGDLAYEDWARAEAERLEECRLLALEERLEAQLRVGRHDEVLAGLRELAIAHPLRERLQGQLMLALYRSGRQAEALDVYASVRSRLREELGLEPGPLLRELQRRILQHDSELQASVVSEHPRFVLPSAPDKLIGRERELGELRELLVRRQARLVVLTGAGGSGKTRLAVEVTGQNAAAFANGAAFVELGPLRDPELVLPTILAALGLPEQKREPLEAIAAALRPRELLLVLDNAEHLPEAAPLYSELLARAPRLTLLVTSRSVLHLSGEHVYPVEPLDEATAAELFVRRADEADHEFPRRGVEQATIDLICERLDRLPLAIEIAASRTRTLSPVELLARLDRRLPLLTGGPRDLPERQQTLRATLEWSHGLLDDAGRLDFRRLAVFAGGCTLEAAEAVCDTTLARVGALVDQHLLRRRTTSNGSRYEMLETIHEYASEQLEQSGEADPLLRRHAEYYLSLAEEAAPQVERAHPQMWLGRLAAENDNFRAALHMLTTTGETQLALRLAGALRPFWMIKGHAREARRWLEKTLDADARPTAARACALVGSVHVTAVAGPADSASLETAHRRAQEAVQIYTDRGDRSGAALAGWALASLATREGEWIRARDLFEQSAQAFGELDDDHFVLAADARRAFVYSHLGEEARARAPRAEPRASTRGGKQAGRGTRGRISGHARRRRRPPRQGLGNGGRRIPDPPGARFRVVLRRRPRPLRGDPRPSRSCGNSSAARRASRSPC
jgi:predicted ATPase/DNA-binding SARP family transcriptional activator